MGQVEEHGFQDSELGDPCGEQPDLDMQEQENTLEESTEGSSEFSELKQMLVQQSNCTGQWGWGGAGRPAGGPLPVAKLWFPSERELDVMGRKAEGTSSMASGAALLPQDS